MAGDTQSGVTIMRMDEGLDTGPMCRVGAITITAEMTAQILHDRLAELGSRLMVETLAQASIACEPQPEDGVTYAKKIDKANANGGRDNISVLLAHAKTGSEKRGLISRLLGK